VVGNKTASAALTSSYVHGLWLKGKESTESAQSVSGDIESAIRERLDALGCIANSMRCNTNSPPAHKCSLCVHKRFLATALRNEVKIPTNKQPTKFGIGQTLDYAHPFLSRIAFVQQYEGTLSLSLFSGFSPLSSNGIGFDNHPAWARCARLKDERVQPREQRLLGGKVRAPCRPRAHQRCLFLTPWRTTAVISGVPFGGG
jgi:hypothetical protein